MLQRIPLAFHPRSAQTYTIEVVIVDKDVASAAAVESILRPHGVATYHCREANDYLASAHFRSDHIALVDMHLTDMNSIDLIRLAVDRSGAVAIFAMAAQPTVAMAVRAMKVGASDFLEKPISIAPILTMLQTPPPRLGHATDLLSDMFLRILSRRELDVATGLLEGKSNKDIARILGISHRTVEIHRRHIFRKLDVRTTGELILRNRSENAG